MTLLCDWCGGEDQLVTVVTSHEAPEAICGRCRSESTTENHTLAGVRWSCDLCLLDLVTSDMACEHIAEDYL